AWAANPKAARPGAARSVPPAAPPRRPVGDEEPFAKTDEWYRGTQWVKGPSHGAHWRETHQGALSRNVRDPGGKGHGAGREDLATSRSIRRENSGNPAQTHETAASHGGIDNRCASHRTEIR